MELDPDSRDLCSGAVQEGESVADTSDWYSGWSRNPPNSWCEEEKSNLIHDTCGAGEQVERNQQEGWAEEQKGGAEDTWDCDRHSNPWNRAEGTGDVQPRREQNRRGEVEAEQQSGKVQGDGQHWTTGGEPLLGWKHGEKVNWASGVKEMGRQLRVPCDEPRFEQPRVER